MVKSNSHIKENRRTFISRCLRCGTFAGLGCSGLFTIDANVCFGEEQQNKQKYQEPTNYNYEQLFNFTFGSWFISYMKQLQKQMGSKKFLKLL